MVLNPIPEPVAAGAKPPAWQRLLRELNHGSVGWAIGLAVTVALMLNPIFIIPFPVVLGRTLFVALVLVLVFHGAGLWHQSWVPRWLLQTLAVAAAAPLATLIAYLVSTSGSLAALVQSPPRVTGFIFIAGSALAIGLVVTLGGLYRERDAQARSQALQFQVERSALERQALDARLALLTAQIEPHFLFNTLANVQALVESGSPRAGPVLSSLIAYLRAAMPRLHAGGMPALQDELNLVRAYLDLMHLRMPDRLTYSVVVDGALQSQRFPAMALLTLVENAVRHGIDPSEQGGHIEIGGHWDAGANKATLWVADTGIGQTGSGDAQIGGTGLTNLRARLHSVFGTDASLDLKPNAPRGTRAQISFTPKA